MGRTNPTFRDSLRGLRERWGAYRRGLRRASQARFDRLFEYAQRHADAAGYLNPADPVVPALFSIDLEQERRLDEVESRIDDLERTVRPTDPDENGVDADDGSADPTDDADREGD